MTGKGLNIVRLNFKLGRVFFQMNRHFELIKLLTSSNTNYLVLEQTP